VPHAFAYPVLMVCIDLAELDEVFRGRWFWSTQGPAWAWLRRADFLGDSSVPLDQAVRDRVEAETGRRPTGPVRLLSTLRMFGLSFNPVSFYYCYDAAGEAIEAIVAEITNTPWNERHAYVLAASAASPGSGAKTLRWRFGKNFHVSPFMPMSIGYDWRFTAPASRLAVHMRNEGDAGALLFDATLLLERREIGTASLALALLRFPFASLRVLIAIYWQALRLKLKRVPFHTHPAKRIEEKTT
jgi:DUF1365 family protein